MKFSPKQAWDRMWKAAPELMPLLLLVPMAIILGLLLLRQEILGQPERVPETIPPQITASLPAVPPSPEMTASPQAQQTVTITIAAADNEQRLQVFVLQEDTAAGVMMRAAGMGLVKLATKDYGGEMGLFVEAINGVANDPAAGRYWTLYVNGERSNLGASSVKVKPGDQIMWKLESITE